MKKLLLSVLVLGCLLGMPPVAQAASLAAANPFEILGELTELTYDELSQLYPALSDADLRSLRWRIVNHMKGLE